MIISWEPWIEVTSNILQNPRLFNVCFYHENYSWLNNLGLILLSTACTQRLVLLMQVEGPRHIRDRGPASDSFAWLYFPRHNFGIWKEWYSCTTCVSICNDIRPAAGLLFQVFLKHCCLRFEPTFKNKLSKGKEAELRLLRGHPYSLLCSIFQSQFWTFMLCNVIIFYESRYLKKKKIKKWVI